MSISWYVPSLATNKVKVYLFLLSLQHKSKNYNFHLINIFISTKKDVQNSLINDELASLHSDAFVFPLGFLVQGVSWLPVLSSCIKVLETTASVACRSVFLSDRAG